MLLEDLQCPIADNCFPSILRAYVFAHASTTGPILLGFLLTFRKRGLNGRQACAKVIEIGFYKSLMLIDAI